jgi:hypothetical protein
MKSQAQACFESALLSQRPKSVHPTSSSSHFLLRYNYAKFLEEHQPQGDPAVIKAYAAAVDAIHVAVHDSKHDAASCLPNHYDHPHPHPHLHVDPPLENDQNDHFKDDALNRLGLFYSRAGQFRRAIETFETGLTLWHHGNHRHCHHGPSNSTLLRLPSAALLGNLAIAYLHSGYIEAAAAMNARALVRW